MQPECGGGHPACGCDRDIAGVVSAAERMADAFTVPSSIERAMRRASTSYYRALDLPLDTFGDQAVRAAQLGAACEDRARCWAAAARWACSRGSGVGWVLVSALIRVRRREDDAARFWRDTASYWRRAAAGADPRDLDAEILGLHDVRGRWAV